MSSAADSAFIERLGSRIAGLIPHVQALGIEVVTIGTAEVVVRLPLRPEFLGDIERGIVHTGIVTTLIDSASGIAVFARIARSEAIATLDLRVDYLRPTVLGTALRCRAECYRLSEQIAFVRASVWQFDEAEPVAISLSTFMRGTQARGQIA